MKNNFSILVGTSLLTSLLSSPAIANKNSVIDFARVTSVEPVYRLVTVREPHRQCEWVPTRHRTRNGNRHNHRDNRQNHPRRFISGDSITHHNTGTRNNTGSAVLVGGVIGGVIGHQLSQSINGHSDPAITLAGAFIGSAVAHDAARDSIVSGHTTRHMNYVNSVNSVESLKRHKKPNSRLSSHRVRDDRHHNRMVERCTTTTVSRQQRQLDGYDVTYVYRGNTFHTRTDQNPGDRIRVRVHVRPH